MNSKINPNVEVGDRIVCITMYGESSVSYRDSGEVTGFGDDISGVQIKVNWDNGSTLPLIKENDDLKYNFYIKQNLNHNDFLVSQL